MKSPKAKFIAEIDLKKLAAYSWDAMQLASTHDPDHEKRFKALEKIIAEQFERILVLERQTQRLGAPQYRRGRKGTV